MKLTSLKPIAASLSVAVVASVAGLAHADQSPFAAKPLVSGYSLAMHDKAHEGSCGGAKKAEGEGGCGANKKPAAEGKCGEGKCGSAEMKTKMAKEGKCGEGKCGATKKTATEGKCGEGKCGANKAKPNGDKTAPKK